MATFGKKEKYKAKARGKLKKSNVHLMTSIPKLEKIHHHFGLR
jgi:hypothetical protein